MLLNLQQPAALCDLEWAVSVLQQGSSPNQIIKLINYLIGYLPRLSDGGNNNNNKDNNNNNNNSNNVQ